MKKSALITGAAGGLGLALVRHLAQQGWQVFAADCDQKGLDTLQGQAGIIPVFMDVTNTESIEAARDEVKHHAKKLDAVVNFAGILRVGALIEMDEALLARVLDINLMGTWRVNKVFFPLLRHGRIVNVSSETGWHTASPFNGPYAMSKYAIEAYSDALRRELSIYGVPVIKVQPGPFKTNLVSNVVEDFNRAADNSKLFGPQLRKFGKMTAEANQKAAEPEYLASVIYQALTDKNPKAAYSVKADPQRSFLEWLPIRVADGIFKKILKES